MKTLAALLLLVTGIAAAAEPPALPYYSVQLGTAGSRAEAREKLKPFANEPYARAERRTSWQIRAGAWKERADADAAAARLGGKVLRMETAAAEWLTPAASTTAPATAGAPVRVPAPPLPPARPVSTELEVTAEFRRAAEKLDEEMRRWLRVEGAQRKDGYVYGMDVAPLMLYAAERGDQTLYLQLLAPARRLVVDDARDPYTRGFVLWRQKPGQPLDVSGATEALWMARALWTGAKAFNRADDRALALAIVEGYSRHAFEMQGIWMVRKYFGFVGRGFAGLSTLSNYHPDFLADVEREAPRSEWAGFAERSYAILDRARARSGLLVPLIQPEVAATYPELNVGIYAPNGIAGLMDACAGAEGAVRGRPQIADAVLSFARDDDHQTRFGRLFGYFDADSGEPRGIPELSSAGYACLGRLAAARNDRRAFRSVAPFLQQAMRSVGDVPSVQGAPLYDGGQLLLAAYAAGSFNPP